MILQVVQVGADVAQHGGRAVGGQSVADPDVDGQEQADVDEGERCAARVLARRSEVCPQGPAVTESSYCGILQVEPSAGSGGWRLTVRPGRATGRRLEGSSASTAVVLRCRGRVGGRVRGGRLKATAALPCPRPGTRPSRYSSSTPPTPCPSPLRDVAVPQGGRTPALRRFTAASGRAPRRARPKRRRPPSEAYPADDSFWTIAVHDKAVGSLSRCLRSDGRV